MPDADVEGTIAACMTSFYGNAGQRCLAGANLIIVKENLGQGEYELFYKKITDTFVNTASKSEWAMALTSQFKWVLSVMRARNEKSWNS